MRRLVLPYGQSSSELLDHSQRRFLFKNVGCIPPACPSVIIDSSDQHPEHLHRRHARAPLIPLLAHGPRCTLPSSSTSTLSSPRFLIPTRPSVLSQPLRWPRNSVCISCLSVLQVPIAIAPPIRPFDTSMYPNSSYPLSSGMFSMSQRLQSVHISTGMRTRTRVAPIGTEG